MYIQRKKKAPSFNHFCYVKAKSIKYSECVSVALVIQHVRRMGFPALHIFSTLSHKGHGLKKIIGHKMCALISSTKVCQKNVSF
jgi:hypothetical protein